MFLDFALFSELKEDDELVYKIWEPEEYIISMGYNNLIEDLIYTDRVVYDKIKDNKRMTGGGPILLSPGMVVISILKWMEEDKISPFSHYSDISRYILRTFELLGLKNNIYFNKNEYYYKEDIFGFSTLRILDKLVFSNTFLFFNNDLNLNFLYMKKFFKYKINISECCNLSKFGFNIDIENFIKMFIYCIENEFVTI